MAVITLNELASDTKEKIMVFIWGFIIEWYKLEHKYFRNYKLEFLYKLMGQQVYASICLYLKIILIIIEANLI